MSEVTRILDAIGDGDAKESDLLLLVYEELRKLAAHSSVEALSDLATVLAIEEPDQHPFL